MLTAERLNRANTAEFRVTAENKTARILCTFLISNKARQVKCAKLFEVSYAPRMHSSGGHDAGPKQDVEYLERRRRRRGGNEVGASGVPKSINGNAKQS